MVMNFGNIKNDIKQKENVKMQLDARC